LAGSTCTVDAAATFIKQTQILTKQTRDDSNQKQNNHHGAAKDRPRTEENTGQTNYLIMT